MIKGDVMLKQKAWKIITTGRSAVGAASMVSSSWHADFELCLLCTAENVCGMGVLPAVSTTFACNDRMRQQKTATEGKCCNPGGEQLLGCHASAQPKMSQQHLLIGGNASKHCMLGAIANTQLVRLYYTK